MSDLEPITKNEKLWSGEDLTPVTRREMYIKHLYDETQVIPEYPVTREEMFILKAGEELHDVTIEQLTATENKTYSEKGVAYSPVIVNVPAPPLPSNAYLKKTATTSMSDAVRLPVASAVVSVTDKDKAELFLTTDGVVSEDNTPYTYRPSPSGKSCVDLSVVGGTVAWNQLVQNGNFADTSKWGTYGTSTSVSNNELTATVTTAYEASGNNIVYNSHSSTIVGHKYFYSCDLFVPSTNNTLTTVKCGLRGTNLVSSTQRDTWETIRGISTVSSSNNIFVIASGSSTTVGDIFKIRKVNVIDLTAMFGSTIADYIYSLEQATAGSGVAYFRNLFPKSYYAYNSGALMSVNASSHVTVGFNQWDEVWELGAFVDATGLPSDYSDRIRTKNFIPIKPSTKYYVKSDKPTRQYFYDKNKNYLGTVETYTRNNEIFTTPSNGYYMKFFVAPAYGTTYNHDICINVSDTSKNGTYEPYKEVSYPLDSDLTLRGIVKKDASNNLYYDGDVYSADGSVKRKYGIVDLSSLTWTKYDVTEGTLFRASVTGILQISASVIGNLITSKYVTISQNNRAEKTISQNGANIDIIDSSYSDATTFKNSLNGVYLVYKLATPTSETADAYENPQLVGSTEEFIDTRDVPIPVGGERKYVNGNIYIKYLDSVTTGDIELADENAIIPLENTTYISSNGSASIDYWSKEE